MSTSQNHFHVYNRGAHKALIFNDSTDYRRFLNLLYLANNTRSFRYDYLNNERIYQHKREDTLVDIVAYCLMPNHFHILITERFVNSKTTFLLKLCTGYSMYYNKKYDHSGTIFQGQYKSKLVDNDEYYNYLIQYIHLNPFSIKEPRIVKTAKPEYLKEAIEYSKKYEYSSYKDYLGNERAQKAILKLNP